ncbi:MAG: FAD-dependent oxidoreductase [Candidatus Micrarchaeaceae archaeon]
MTEDEHYDVAIVGGGIMGTSVLYTLSKFSDVGSIILFEKNDRLAQESTNSRNNAQTLHVGDIETNYSIEKVVETKAASELVLKYSSTLPEGESSKIIYPTTKMVLGVGDREVEFVDKRYSDKFLSIFPNIRKMDAEEISKTEPYITKGRDKDERILAAYSDSGNIVSFNTLAESFASNSLYNGKHVKVSLGEYAKEIKEANGAYRLITSKSAYTADFVVLAAGGYSLYFAKTMGYGKDLSLLSVGGHFYHSKKVLNGKVYRVQKGGIPFAAVHGDPDINYPDRTRFGPTVSVLPYLENARDITTESHMKAFGDYIKALGMDKDTIESLFNIISDRDIARILVKNAGYSMPEAGKYMLVKDEVNSIVPSLKNSDVVFDSGSGGVRPQIIDKKQKELVLGVVELKMNGLIFDMAPSPGASACLKSALEDSIDITNHLGRKFDVGEYSKIFCATEEERKSLFGSIRSMTQ